MKDNPEEFPGNEVLQLASPGDDGDFTILDLPNKKVKLGDAVKSDEEVDNFD